MKFKFLKNAAILTATGFLLRGLGMLFRIYISSRIGEEGMGVYQLVTSAYFLFITLAQSGLSTAVTRLCAKCFAHADRAGAEGVLKSGICCALFTGFGSMTLMLLLSKIISKIWIGDMRAVYALRVLAFSLPFIAVCGMFSAYFMADKNVVNGCTAQIIEQLSRLAVAAAALFFFAGKDMAALLAAVVFANTVSEGVSCAYLALRYAFGKKPANTVNKSYKSQIIRGAVPVALSRYLSSALHTAENMLVPTAMAVYTGSRADALADFGALKGMALPLLFFPFSLLGALSSLLLPEITEAAAKNQTERSKSIIKRTCHLTLVSSIMIAGVFFTFAQPLGMLIYKSRRVSYIIKVLSLIVPFMYLDSICDGLLKGLGKQKQVLYNNMIDSGTRIVAILLLVTRFGLDGFLAVMVISNVTVSLLNLFLLLKTVGVKFDFLHWFLLPVFALLLSAIITKFLMPLCATLPKTLLGCALFCLIFALLTVVFNIKNKKYNKFEKKHFNLII